MLLTEEEVEHEELVLVLSIDDDFCCCVSRFGNELNKYFWLSSSKTSSSASSFDSSLLFNSITVFDLFKQLIIGFLNKSVVVVVVVVVFAAFVIVADKVVKFPFRLTAADRFKLIELFDNGVLNSLLVVVIGKDLKLSYISALKKTNQNKCKQLKKRKQKEERRNIEVKIPVYLLI